jgi:hypothetical protein
MPAESTENYQNLKGRLISRGFTLRSFALLHGFKIPTVYKAAKGSRNGIIATRIRRKLEEVSGA